jgi:hypothetical protein
LQAAKDEKVIAKIDRLREEAERDYTYKPRVVRSRSLGNMAVDKDTSGIGRSENKLDIHERLFFERKVQDQNAVELRRKKTEAELTECTFTPEVGIFYFLHDVVKSYFPNSLFLTNLII